MDANHGKPPVGAVAVAASAGGVEALTAFVAHLPADFPAVVLVVLHVPATGPSVLPGILARAGRLPALHARGATQLRRSVVMVAPPGQHLWVQDSRAEVDRGPREHGHRPSADKLFRSVAESFGPRAAGVVLSGTMDDGAAGLRAIALAGGFTIVQDPAEAAFPGMPTAAIIEAHPDVVCRAEEMASRLSAWASQLTPTHDLAGAVDPHTNAEPAKIDELSEFTCPECGGTLWLAHAYGTERFRCRVGHTYSSSGLLVGKQEAVEAALWAAVVALEERADISARLLKRLEGIGRPMQVRRYREEIERTGERTAILRGLINDLVKRVPVMPGDFDGPEPSQ